MTSLNPLQTRTSSVVVIADIGSPPLDPSMCVAHNPQIFMGFGALSAHSHGVIHKYLGGISRWVIKPALGALRSGDASLILATLVFPVFRHVWALGALCSPTAALRSRLPGALCIMCAAQCAP
jgi:hypothetical protein